MTKDFGMGPVTILARVLYTPDPKTSWDDHEVTVFGSNTRGHHWGGAARYANMNLGAEWGVGEGRTGQTYAFPTLTFPNTDLVNAGASDDDREMNMVSEEAFAESFQKLKTAILAEPDKVFYITKLGLGIAGWTLPAVFRMFWESGIPFECENIIYPVEFELPDDAFAG